MEAVVQVLNFYQGSNFGGPSWLALLAMTGRKEALSDLGGDGLATLQERS